MPNNGLGTSVDDGQPRAFAMAYQSHLDDPEHWRDRAEQVRTLADGISNQRARDSILAIAAEYELIADRAQERARRGQP